MGWNRIFKIAGAGVNEGVEHVNLRNFKKVLKAIGADGASDIGEVLRSDGIKKILGDVDFRRLPDGGDLTVNEVGRIVPADGASITRRQRETLSAFNREIGNLNTRMERTDISELNRLHPDIADWKRTGDASIFKNADGTPLSDEEIMDMKLKKYLDDPTLHPDPPGDQLGPQGRDLFSPPPDSLEGTTTFGQFATKRNAAIVSAVSGGAGLAALGGVGGGAAAGVGVTEAGVGAAEAGGAFMNAAEGAGELGLQLLSLMRSHILELLATITTSYCLTNYTSLSSSQIPDDENWWKTNYSSLSNTEIIQKLTPSSFSDLSPPAPPGVDELIELFTEDIPELTTMIVDNPNGISEFINDRIDNLNIMKNFCFNYLDWLSKIIFILIVTCIIIVICFTGFKYATSNDKIKERFQNFSQFANNAKQSSLNRLKTIHDSLPVKYKNRSVNQIAGGKDMTKKILKRFNKNLPYILILLLISIHILNANKNKLIKEKQKLKNYLK